ncbi:hypothetical protein GOP47_0004170 [Adiantum capillus-veneris]|uniref:Uncharacterized protein n=1 Tax=Adiantum capillus-veneris TaxID=13818 RepID=A0A9D4V7N0_ADICA|nr:hypothetical protein GOP47_0004170 [Adiantum capillus-veneris]
MADMEDQLLAEGSRARSKANNNMKAAQAIQKAAKTSTGRTSTKLGFSTMNNAIENGPDIHEEMSDISDQEISRVRQKTVKLSFESCAGFHVLEQRVWEWHYLNLTTSIV